MRLGCWSCTFKHVGQAAVNCEEVHCGYRYMHKVCGHLQDGAEECYQFSPKFALVLRAHRIHYEDTLPDPEPGRYMIPFEAFEDYIRDCVIAKEQGIEAPEVPDDCCEGLGRNEDGTFDLMFGDTRPFSFTPEEVKKILADDRKKES